MQTDPIDGPVRALLAQPSVVYRVFMLEMLSLVYKAEYRTTSPRIQTPERSYS